MGTVYAKPENILLDPGGETDPAKALAKAEPENGSSAPLAFRSTRSYDPFMAVKPTEWLKTVVGAIGLVTGGVGGLLALFKQWGLPVYLVGILFFVIVAVAAADLYNKHREEKKLVRGALAQPSVPELPPAAPPRHCHAAPLAGAAAIDTEPDGRPVIRVCRCIR